MVESWGRGISKILDECEKANVPKPTFDLSMGGVDVRFIPKIFEFNTSFSTDTPQKTTVKTMVKTMVKTTVKILNLIEINSEVTIPQLAQALELSKSAVEWQIKKLKSEKKLERIGADKGGYWKIIRK